MHEEGCDHCRSNESYGHSLTEPAVPACKSGEYNPPPSVPHMDGKRAAPRKGRRVVFAGIRFLCRAGPMCSAEKCVPGGGARGPRPTGCCCADGTSYPTGVYRRRSLRDVVPQGHLFRCAPLQDAVPYRRLPTAYRVLTMAGRKYTPPRRRDFSSCRWQTDDGVPCVRRGGLTQAGRKRSRPGI